MLCEACKARFKRVFGPVLGLLIGAVFFSVPPLLDSQSTSPLTIQVATNRVGVNTTTPAEALDVNGNVKAANFIGNGSQLQGLPSSSQWTTSGNNISYSTGNVGVGTASPGQKLDVAGDIRTSGVYRVNTTPGKTQSLLPLAGAQCEHPYIAALEITGGIITSIGIQTDNCP